MSSREVEEEDASPPKKLKCSTTFRISVKLPPSLGHHLNLNIQAVSKCLGSAVAKRMSVYGWQISLKRPQIEMVANVMNNTTVLIGVPLSTKPLSERPYLRHIPLRSTVAYAVAYSAIFPHHKYEQPAEKVSVIDPMCGAATILLELVKSFGAHVEYAVGIDNDESQLEKASENVNISQEPFISLIRGSVTTASKMLNRWEFDCLVCDIPFGLKFSTVLSVKESIPLLVQAFHDLLDKRNGRMCLLISYELSDELKQALQLQNQFKLICEHSLRLGKLESVLLVYYR